VKNRLADCLIGVTGLLAISFPLFAHHGTSEYEDTKVVSLAATVVELQYVNPHALIVFTAKDANGHPAEWTAELQSPNLLSRRGWSRSTLKPGDQVIITGHPVKNGANAMAAQKVVFADGRETPNMGLPRDSSK
jgi:hypothetical protein